MHEPYYDSVFVDFLKHLVCLSDKRAGPVVSTLRLFFLGEMIYFTAMAAYLLTYCQT